MDGVKKEAGVERSNGRCGGRGERKYWGVEHGQEEQQKYAVPRVKGKNLGRLRGRTRGKGKSRTRGLKK